MVSKSETPATNAFTRDQLIPLVTRLREPRRFIQALVGPRQVGKTTLARQAASRCHGPVQMASADLAGPADRVWLEQQWEAARVAMRTAGTSGLLILDEIQKIPQWSAAVKALWDADTASGIQLHTLILGSSPMLMQQGLVESLAGRFEVIRVPHWSFAEMREAFGWSVEQYIYFGGYPGAASLIGDEARWRAYINDSLIETTVSRDILLMTRVDKPALLRRTFDLACRYSGQILSYQKMLGQLQDAGNTTTLAHYIDLLHGAGFVAGLQKFCGQSVRQRASSPKLQVLNTALVSALQPLSFQQALADHHYWGHLVESAVGAHLLNQLAGTAWQVQYWNEGAAEVDFVLANGKQIIALEVKSQRRPIRLQGMPSFCRHYSDARPLLIGGDGTPIEQFLVNPVSTILT